MACNVSEPQGTYGVRWEHYHGVHQGGCVRPWPIYGYHLEHLSYKSASIEIEQRCGIFVQHHTMHNSKAIQEPWR